MTAAQGNKTTETLMIVEDEALVATLLRDELQDAGYKVLNLTDRHAEAIEVARAEKPNLALVNIRLAGGSKPPCESLYFAKFLHGSAFDGSPEGERFPGGIRTCRNSHSTLPSDGQD